MEKTKLFKPNSFNLILYIILVSLFLLSCSDRKGSGRNISVLIPVGNGEGFGYIDTQGKVIIPFRYRYAGFFGSNGLAPVLQDTLFGYINKNGDWVIRPSYSFAFPFYCNMAKSTLPNNDDVFIRPDGSIAYKIDYSVYSEVGYQYSNAGVIAKGHKPNEYFLINKEGASVLNFNANDCCFLNNDYVLLRYFNRGFDSLKVIDLKGRTAFRSSEVQWIVFSDNVYQVHYIDSGRVCLLTNDFKISMCYSDKYSITGEIHEGKLPFKAYGGSGYLNKKGDVSIDPIFEGCYEFQGGLAAARLNGKIGFIDHNGQVQVPFIFDELLRGFEDGYAILLSGDFIVFINESGKEFWKMKKNSVYMQIFDFL